MQIIYSQFSKLWFFFYKRHFLDHWLRVLYMCVLETYDTDKFSIKIEKIYCEYLKCTFTKKYWLIWLRQVLVVACEHLAVACGISFPDQGLNPGFLYWECGVLATGPLGKSLYHFLDCLPALNLTVKCSLWWSCQSLKAPGLHPVLSLLNNLYRSIPASCTYQWPCGAPSQI